MPKKKRRRETRDGLEEVNSVGKSTRGPPVATTSGRLHEGSIENDEWQTMERSWAAVATQFDQWRSKRIWMPFYYDGACAGHLRRLGFRHIIHTNDDFFERVQDSIFMDTVDLIWDNPPYTSPEMKERVLRALAATQKPFAMLLPISVLHVAFVRDILDMNAVQAIVPRRVWVRKMDGDEKPFKYLCWLCSGLGLHRDLVFVDDDDE